MIQFTYRLWPYAIVLVVIGIVMILSENRKYYTEKKKVVIFIAIIGCTVLAGLFQNRMIAASSLESKEFDEKYLAEHNNYVGAGEWLPLGVLDEVVDLSADGYVVSDKAVKQEIKVKGNMKFFSNNALDEYYHVPLIYYKGYAAKLCEENGKETQLEVRMDENDQVLIVNQKQKQGEIYIFYKGTVVQRISKLISICAIIFIVIFWKLYIKTKNGEQKYAEGTRK